jgi:hypothetical protein
MIDYATRFSSLTSISLQDGQATTSKSKRPSGLGTLRTSLIALPHEGQRRIGRLSAKIMITTPEYAVCGVIAESAPGTVEEMQRSRFL